MLIYNYVSTVDAPISWNEFLMEKCLSYSRIYPILQQKWYMTFHITNNKFIYNISKIFLHFIPALFLDFIFLFMGNAPKMYKMSTKVFKYLEVVKVFAIKDWNWKANNIPQLWKRLHPDDQKMFKFSLSKFNWNEYSKNYMIGVKVYLFKENLNTLEASKRHVKR